MILFNYISFALIIINSTLLLMFLYGSIKNKANNYFVLFMLCVVLWVVGVAWAWNAMDLHMALYGHKFSFIGPIIMPVLFLYFVLFFLNRRVDYSITKNII